MTDSSNDESLAAPAQVRKRGGISLVWIVPIVALLVGGWLVFKAMSEKGPVVTITFSTAEGLEAGKTKIKFKDVVVGQVEEIRLGDDLTHVVVTAELVRDYARFLNDKTRSGGACQIRGGTASGLNTLLSGAYIGVAPAWRSAHLALCGSRQCRRSSPPPARAAFLGQGQAPGSLNVGVPVYYRQIRWGR
jgi:paraquat-inducible protein B